jgi:lipopolysaccharide transport system permease protein
MSSTAEILREEKPPASKPEVVAASAPTDDLPLTVIEPRSGWQLVNLRELWRYRELFFFLTWRDVKVRYKQTALGAAWAILVPLATMLVFSLFIGRAAGIAEGFKDKGYPYYLFVFAGLIPWTFFAFATNSGGMSVVGNQNLVTKVYFPRLIIPMSAVGAGLVDFLIAFAMLLILMLFNGITPGWSFLWVPILTLITLAGALGVGTFLAALTVAYRDFRHAVPFMVQLWMWSTPCIYLPTEKLGPTSKLVMPLNPAYGLIENFRLAMLNESFTWYSWYSLGVSSAVSVALLLVGCLYFRRVERSFADII